MSAQLLLVYSLVGVSVFLQLISISSCQSSADSTCTTPNGLRGQCINIKLCPAVNGIIAYAPTPIPDSTKEYLRSLTCGFEGRNPKVCCIILPNTTREDIDQLEDPPAVEGHPNMKLLPTNCGIVYEVRVVGGNKPKVFEFPWMAHVLFHKSDSDAQEFKCGGTVLNERYILTAGHCLTHTKPYVVHLVRVGEHDVSQFDCNDDNMKACAPQYQDLTVEETIPHPDYNGSIGAQRYHDIGLIRLASPIDFSQMNVVPICIPHLKTYREKLLNNTELWISGWGQTLEAYSSQNIVSEKIPYVPNDQCAPLYKRKGQNLRFTQMCAGGLDGGDACRGDGGGPLQAVEYFDEQQRYVQYGIVSYGPLPCGQPGFPSVYTRVPYYVKWILDTIKP